MKTADILDEYETEVAVADSIGLRSYGGQLSFCGKIRTIKCFEDNSFVRKCLESDGQGCVLVVDGGGSRRCALLGDINASLALKNNWIGLVINGCIRDSTAIAGLPLGVWASGTNPKKSVKRNEGELDITVNFAGIDFVPNHYIYVDADGIVVSSRNLVS